VKRKQGFGVPLEYWFRGALSDFARDNLSPAELQHLDVIQTASVSQLLEEHRCGRRDNSALIWNLLNLVFWRRAAERKPATAVEAV
jgi:asparagine synthase (glutamine-hydrolysing)